jgi:RING finger and CHY zinc finger domain-containing protein 1
MVDIAQYESFYDAQLAAMPMPTEYRDKKMAVQCNDCLQKSAVPFHIMGGKCNECKSYNTTRIGDELIDERDRVFNGDE